jgi:hypothetical protein
MSVSPDPLAEEEEVTRLLSELQRSTRTRNVSLVGCATLTFVILLGAFSSCMGHYDAPEWPWLALYGGIAAGLVSLTYHLAAKNKRKKAILELAYRRDKRIIPIMLAASIAPEHQNDLPAIRGALLALLPFLTEEDASLFSSSPRGLVGYCLASRDVVLVCALLDAVDRMGATWALPHVEWLLRRKGVNAEIRRVKDAAKRCADSLHRRIEQGRHPKRLLRPAGASASEELLRSVEGSHSMVAELLLRPDGEDETAQHADPADG